MTTTPKVLTYEEWLKLPEAEGIEEVVNGEIRKMPPNKWNHARTVEELARLIRLQVDPEKIYVVTTVFGLMIRQEPLTTRVPDMAVFHVDQIVEQDGYIHSAPELVVEVLSPANTRAERAEKLKDYESLRVAEVWVVSPEARSKELAGQGHALPMASRRLALRTASLRLAPVRTNVQTPVAGRRLSDTCPTKRSCPRNLKTIRNCATRVRALRRRRNRGGHLIKGVESLRDYSG